MEHGGGSQTRSYEAFAMTLRNITNNGGAFASETALLKVLYLTTQRISAAWTKPSPGWPLTIQQLSILFGDRVKSHLKT